MKYNTTTAQDTKVEAGDVVRHTGVTFNRCYPEAVGVVESVTRESNGIFAMVTWTVELDLLPARSRKIAKDCGATGTHHQFTARAALRVLQEIK
jgi:hypothetical protein